MPCIPVDVETERGGQVCRFGRLAPVIPTCRPIRAQRSQCLRARQQQLHLSSRRTRRQSLLCFSEEQNRAFYVKVGKARVLLHKLGCQMQVFKLLILSCMKRKGALL